MTTEQACCHQSQASRIKIIQEVPGIPGGSSHGTLSRGTFWSATWSSTRPHRCLRHFETLHLLFERPEVATCKWASLCCQREPRYCWQGSFDDDFWSCFPTTCMYLESAPSRTWASRLNTANRQIAQDKASKCTYLARLIALIMLDQTYRNEGGTWIRRATYCLDADCEWSYDLVDNLSSDSLSRVGADRTFCWCLFSGWLWWDNSRSRPVWVGSEQDVILSSWPELSLLISFSSMFRSLAV
jgi:hypothetical protein